MRKIIGMIPARYGSTRYPGKLLIEVHGHSLIKRTYENALNAQLFDELIIATDDQRIADHAKEIGAPFVMTSPDCPSGTDRIAEAVQNKSKIKERDIIVNVQGDEPLLEPEVFQAIIALLETDPKAVCATAVTLIKSEKEALNPSNVKCVMNQKGHALYFSRQLIPSSHTKTTFDPQMTYYKHFGIYAFRKDFLLNYVKLPPTPLQQAENLEQLKILEYGYPIHVANVESQAHGIDTPEDMEHLKRLLC